MRWVAVTPTDRFRHLVVVADVATNLSRKGRFGVEDGDFPELTPEDAKMMTMQSLTEPEKFAEHILNKAWLMFETSPAHPFFIGDNPVTLQNNTQPKGPFAETLASRYAESRFTSRLVAPSLSRSSAVRMRR